MKSVASLAGALVLGLLSGTCALAEYPERPIWMVVAYSAGGGTDIAARAMVPYIEKHLGNGAKIAVINAPGAGGEIGFTKLAQADPDGYTIGFINTPNLLTIPISRNTRYKLEDLQPVANVVYDPGAFSVLPSADFNDLRGLIEYAKANPGKVTYGTTGLGSDDHLAALEFERLAGVELKHVPFPGNADVRAAVLGGIVMMASMNISETVADAAQGNLVILGQMAEDRWEGAPDVPTFEEQGYKVIMGSDRGIGAPAGIPDDIRAKLEDAIKKTIDDPDFKEMAHKLDLPLAYQSSSDFQAHLNDLNITFQELWETSPWVEK